MRKLILMSSLALLAMSAATFAQTSGAPASPSIASIVSNTPPQFLASALTAALEANPSLGAAAVAYAKTASPGVEAANGTALEVAAANYAALHPGAPNPYLIAMTQADPETHEAFDRAAGQGGHAFVFGGRFANAYTFGNRGSRGGRRVVSPH